MALILVPGHPKAARKPDHGTELLLQLLLPIGLGLLVFLRSVSYCCTGAGAFQSLNLKQGKQNLFFTVGICSGPGGDPLGGDSE